MKKSLIALALAACAAVAGCAATMPQSPQQTVFAAKGAYVTALNVAVAYTRLPSCSAVQKPPCKTNEVVLQLQKADAVAAAALDSAESAVRSPGFGKDAAASAVAAASAAVQALTSITLTLGVKP